MAENSRYLAAVVRSREMARVLEENHLLVDDDAGPTALGLLCLSGFYGRMSFTQTLKILLLIWQVWENNIDPQEIQNADDRATALHTMLQDWSPKTGVKPS